MIGKKKEPKKKTPEQEQIELGKKLQAFYDSGYIDRKQALGFSLLKGIAVGAGTVVGATVGVALLLWVLSLFSEIPFLGEITSKVQNTIETGQNQ